jgi:hypothetical protein
MNTSLAEVLRHDCDDTIVPGRDAGPHSLVLPLESWPEQAVDACAPEGVFGLCVGTADVRSTGLWA